MVRDYKDVLLTELRAVREHLPHSVTLSRLHLGGGTPTMIRPSDMEHLLDTIYAALPRTDTFECSVEIDTMQVTEPMIQTLTDLGMSRATIGVQDFDPRVQRAIGRAQSFEQTVEVTRLLRRKGLEQVDMEILFGLPRQTGASIANTTQQVLSMDPDRISVAEYSHAPNIAKRQFLIDARALPSAEEAFLSTQIARQILLTDGYEPVGIDHFVKPGDRLIAARDNQTLRRDFEGYSDNASYALIGLGASGISRFPQGYVQNAAATSVYRNLVNSNGLAGSFGYDMSHSDHVVAYMIDRIMCRFELDLPALHAKFPNSSALIEQLLDAVRAVYAACIEETPKRLTLKSDYHPLARIVCSTIDHLGPRIA